MRVAARSEDNEDACCEWVFAPLGRFGALVGEDSEEAEGGSNEEGCEEGKGEGEAVEGE